MKHIVVLGGGRVGAAMARDLAPDFRVTVADLSLDTLGRLEAGGLGVRQADLASPEGVKAAVADADLVVGSVPGFMGFRTMRSVLEAGKDIVDISFYEEDPFELDALAKSQGRIALMDCGIAPGCGNIILGDLERRLDSVQSWECLVGGLPVLRSWPWEYKAGFSPIDVLEEYTRPARYVVDGKLVTFPALSEPELIEFPGVGTLESFNTDGLRSLIRTSKAPNRKEKTLRYPGHIEKMRMLREAGFLSKAPVQVGGQPVVPLDLTCALLFPQWQMKEGEADFTIMRVTVEGTEGGRKRRFVWELLDRYDPVRGETSMARTTVAAGLYTRKGVSPPEYLGEAGCWDFVRTELAKRNVIFRETQG